MKFGMQAILTAEKGEGNAFANIMLRASEIVADIKGCELYLVQQSLQDENKILITELWENQKCHQASLESPLVRALIGEAKPLIVGMEGVPTRFVGGHGLS